MVLSVAFRSFLSYAVMLPATRSRSALISGPSEPKAKAGGAWQQRSARVAAPISHVRAFIPFPPCRASGSAAVCVARSSAEGVSARRSRSVEDGVPALAHAVHVRLLESALRLGPLLDPATDTAGGASDGSSATRATERRADSGAGGRPDQATGHHTGGRRLGRVSRDLQRQVAALLQVSAHVLRPRAAECVDGGTPRLLGRAPGAAEQDDADTVGRSLHGTALLTTPRESSGPDTYRRDG